MAEITGEGGQRRDGEAVRAPSWGLRAARPGDGTAILRLVRELAEFEREPDAVRATVGDLEEALFGADAHARCLLAEVEVEGGPEAVVAGMALWYPTFSTWTGRRGIWLEDLYVDVAHRRLGIGRALVAELARTCVDNGWARLEWDVLDWNTDAIAFYRRIGAAALPEWVRQRVSGEALTGLAQGLATGTATGTAQPSER